MKKNLAVIFGTNSAEHEVSIVSTFQAWEWIDPSKYNRFLIYIDRQNQAHLCPNLKKEDYQHFIKKVLQSNKPVQFVKEGMLVGKGIGKKKVKIDVALLVMHGAFGEDGKIQGMFDYLDIAYTGSGVLGSVLGIDKVAMKNVLTKLNLLTAPYVWFYDLEYRKNPRRINSLIKKELKLPYFVKPATSGSSIGISKVVNQKSLKKAIEKASRFDHKILVEEGMKNAVDINCAVMGGYEPVVSVCEQPLTEKEFLSFHEKYLKGGKTKGMAGLSRIVPAPIPDKVARNIQAISKTIFKELGCWGMARIDYLYQKKTQQVFPNEINTIPGSLAFYLWQASGIKPPQLIDKMVQLALEKEKEFKRLDYSFKSKILDQK